MEGQEEPPPQVEKENQAHKAPPKQQLCRFYSQGRYCQFGKRCRFLHQRGEAKQALVTLENKTPGTNGKEDEGAETQMEAPGRSQDSGPDKKRNAPAKKGRLCRYFLSGFCVKEDQCRFLHPQRLPPVEDQPSERVKSGASPGDPLCSLAQVQREVKLAEITEELSRQLRDTEIQQLLKRFPEDRLIVQEREDGQFTYYRITVQSTDPDWPFDLKDLDVLISFPEKYPQEVFTVEIPEDQDLPAVMGRHVQLASQEWLQAKHATNQLMGKLELLFRPFLRWLDRSMERMFTEGARQLKKDIDLEKAGIQFVSYQQLQETICKDLGSSAPSETCFSPGQETDRGDLEVEEEKQKPNLDVEEESDSEEGSQKVENIRTSERRRGTEVKLLGLRLGEGTGTVVAKSITVSLQCSRCKVTSDLHLSGRLACTAQCEKCSMGISAAFRPSMLHHFSDVLGYLDLSGVVPVDLVLQDSELLVGCLNCSREDTLQSLSYGQNKETNCPHCHSRLSVLVESTRFQFIQPQSKSHTGGSALYQQRERNPAIQGGKPLPDKGTCKHFRQSHRWLRFPCCGKAYPCDMCHDEDQDHPMELASRMICGYCAKEQAYSSGKPCVSCGSFMTRNHHSSHWEGGQGCRNKVKMSRNDRQKYANSNKTVSRKTNNEK
ncbi:uncharacterized protein LOC114766504 [Denticeps clupeoides]|uniref:Nucleoporin NUP42 n=1 Tax=Denticeps clupeoides TaxID=299321 RepID=A0AAY4C3Z0_9TELE|nr:uncharacterized protein LOC114766504 [Denticeps clupeoides]XP_028813100.1 uncharacterized protein LOC114766504 [Denticeps clupeoides]